MAYTLLTEGADEETVGRIDADLFSGALDDEWGD